MTADTKIRISAETNQAERALVSLGRASVGLTGNLSSLTGAAGALGGALSITAFGAFIKSNIDAADSLGDLSKVTKLTVEQLAGVSLAAKQTGSDLGGTADSISKLAENMGKDREKFAAMGITARDPIEAFKQLADVYNAIDDPQKQADFGAAALGKSWKDAAPLLAEGSEQIGRMIERGTALAGNVKDAAARADQFNDQIAEMDAQMSGLGMTLASVMLPGLTDTATAMNKLAAEGHPVLALWRGLAGMGKVSWDLLFPPENLKESLSSANRLRELQSELAEIEAYLQRTNGRGDGLVGRWLHGTADEQRQRAEVLRNQIATIKKHAEELDRVGSVDPSGKPKPKTGNVDAFIGGGNDAEQKRIDAEIERQQAKYDKLNEMSILYSAKEQDRVTWKLAFDLDAMSKERDKAIEHKAWNDDLEASYQQARIDREAMAVEEIGRLRKKELEEKQRVDGLEIQFMRATFQFKKSMRMADLGNALGILAQATEGMAMHSRRAFEINKAASIASILVKAPKIITDAFDSGQNEWGSYWGGVAYAAAATIAIGAQLSAAQSASFGGGGSVAPSAGGTAGMPASSAADQAGTSPVAPVQGQEAKRAPRSTVHLYGKVFDAQTVRDLAALMSEAAADGVVFDVVTD